MTDKEMIINGVDVSECEHSFEQFNNWVGKDVVMCDCTLGYRCEPKENHCKFYMYYLEQQLKRKEQECEELKKTIKLQNEMQMEVCEEKNEEIEKLKAKKEEIKKYLDISHKTILERLEELTDFRDGDMEEIDQLKAKNDEYSLFIEKLCDYVGLECDDEEQAMRTLSDFARQMNKAIWIIDRHRQTLAEIEKQVKAMNNECFYSDFDCMNCDMQNGCTYFNKKQILQKINECEEKYEN